MYTRFLVLKTNLIHKNIQYMFKRYANGTFHFMYTKIINKLVAKGKLFPTSLGDT